MYTCSSSSISISLQRAASLARKRGVVAYGRWMYWGSIGGTWLRVGPFYRLPPCTLVIELASLACRMLLGKGCAALILLCAAAAAAAAACRTARLRMSWTGCQQQAGS
jgi:hypothetical protein